MIKHTKLYTLQEAMENFVFPDEIIAKKDIEQQVLKIF